MATSAMGHGQFGEEFKIMLEIKREDAREVHYESALALESE